MEEDVETKELLDELIRMMVDDIETLSTGSEEMTRAVENLNKLYRLKIDESKVNWDADEKYDRRTMDAAQFDEEMLLKQKQAENDERLKKEQSKNDRIDRMIRICTCLFEVGAPLIFYAHWMRQGFEFEKNGAITSSTFRNLINRFRPTAK